MAEADLGLAKLAMMGAALIFASTALAVIARYLPPGFYLRAWIVSGSDWLAIAVPTVFYVSCLTSLGGLARESGEFLWRAWILAALTTGVWPFACLFAAILVTAGPDLSPQTQRIFHLAPFLPAIQLTWWSIAAGIGRRF